jgi:hypothetical protein
MKTASLLLALALPGTALAADHAEAPGAGADPAADIGDFFAWHIADGSITTIITFAPLTGAGGAATYDADVLYTVNIDTDADGAADAEILVRFGQNTAGDWGVQAENVPGASAPLVGAVDAVVAEGSAQLYAGLVDDPFFFDLEGYGASLAAGAVLFDSSRDSLAGLNVTAIAIEFDASSLGSTQVQAWATTARK